MQACKEFSARVHGIIGLEESRWEEQATGCLISRFKTGEQLFRAGGKIQGSFAGTSPTACSRTTWAGTGASSRSSRRSPCTWRLSPWFLSCTSWPNYLPSVIVYQQALDHWSQPGLQAVLLQHHPATLPCTLFPPKWLVWPNRINMMTRTTGTQSCWCLSNISGCMLWERYAPCTASRQG